MTTETQKASLPRLQKRNLENGTAFAVPIKRINEGQDLHHFLVSRAYVDITTFLLQLNAAIFPRRTSASDPKSVIKSWDLRSESVEFSDTVNRLRKLLERLQSTIDEAPPDPGPRRFGNISFRKWYEIVESRIGTLLDEFVSQDVLRFGNNAQSETSAKDELTAYLLGSFGSAQRLDYGTGHELSFLAFLAGLWKLGAFQEEGVSGNEERGLVLGVFHLYFQLIRQLIKTYTLEPAGSHGVWGLDDHSFMPYIFGSAQLGPPLSEGAPIPTEGSLPGAPDPGNVSKGNMVEKYRQTNMYFDAIGFIFEVKKGPFWEHSPMLYDISGVTAGWAKINKGMIKMYNAEVLSKFPVVQHFPFGSLFSFDRDPAAAEMPASVHAASQPATGPQASAPVSGTRAPWGSGRAPRDTATPTAAPWASKAPPPAESGTTAPWASARNQPPPPPPPPSQSGVVPTAAPWAKPR